MKLYQTKLYLVSTVFASEKEEKQADLSASQTRQADEEPSKDKSNHFAKLYFDVLDNENFKELSPMACKIYMRLLRYADWKTGKCYPSQRTLARECGCSRRTVNPRIDELVKKGYIRKGKEKGNRTIYYITAYGAPLVQSTSQGGVKSASQGCEVQFTRGVKSASHKQEISNENINNKQQQEQNSLEDEDLIHTTSSGSKPETVKSVCCRISSLFSKKFHTELPDRFIKEKINPREVFDDQFYIKIIQTQQKMPDNPIGWWRSIDSTWVIDENARPVDSVGRGWQIRTTTVDVDVLVEREKEEEEKLRAEAEKIREERLQEAIRNFPPPEEYAKKRVQDVVKVRNMMVGDGVLHAKPYTEEEIESLRQKYIDSYPFNDEQKRKELLWYNKEFDLEKIMDSLREKRRLEKSKGV